ncbi:MAG: hypothetical protein HWE16_05590 [Gammaproteobacteria bacterium]|nr:hypothetical protein [Gammaproteobacteria bacterium]
MLLRRITQHIKNQNWFAVFIDFVIVVVGVFIGIQVANWNERINDKKRAENYKVRLIEEMTNNRNTLFARQDSFAQQIEYGLAAMEHSQMPISDEAAWSIIRDFFQISHVFTITIQRGTYDEIINSGDLALLEDQNLVNNLSDFYSFSGFSSIQIIPRYRENVRRIIPFELQKYFQTQCYKVTIPDTHELIRCPPPKEHGDLINLAKTLQSNNELKADLRYMLSYAGVSSNIAGNLNNRAEAILDILSGDKNVKDK